MEHRVNGTLLTPSMKVIVTVNSLDPFVNCAEALKEEYMRVWNYDYKRAGASKGWFTVERLD